MSFSYRLTAEDLGLFRKRVIDSGFAEGRDAGEGYLIAAGIMGHFLGREWIADHIDPDTSADEFFCDDLSTTGKRSVHIRRVIDLAEMLFNLQGVENFGDCVTRLASADKSEPIFAEMEVGKILFILDIWFRFILPQQKRGRDYDLEIRFADGRPVFADAKCKLESTEPSIETVKHSLNRARGQLPAGEMNVVFLKVPESWMRSESAMGFVEHAALDFLRTTSRIVSVKVYAMIHEFEGTNIFQIIRGCDYVNGRTELEPYSRIKIFSVNRVGVGPKWAGLTKSLV
jgi:hypothetical protein